MNGLVTEGLGTRPSESTLATDGFGRLHLIGKVVRSVLRAVIYAQRAIKEVVRG